MATWHGYWTLENLNLNATQRSTLRAAILDYFHDHREPTHQPAELLHTRISLDGSKVILEAKFDESHLTVNRFKQFLANVFNVTVGTIDSTSASVQLAGRATPVITFGRGGTNYIRVALFGGVGATWQQSRDAVIAYLDSARAEWDLITE